MAKVPFCFLPRKVQSIHVGFLFVETYDGEFKGLFWGCFLDKVYLQSALLSKTEMSWWDTVWWEIPEAAI